MKANELMLGNWVRLRHRFSDGEEIVKDFQVTEIRTHHGPDDYYIWGERGNMGKIDDIEPITLTEEILEKNGWSPITYKIEGAENVHCRPMEVAKDYVVFEVSCGWGAYPVVFVHQLQHLLRLFEIDKEIEL